MKRTTPTWWSNYKVAILVLSGAAIIALAIMMIGQARLIFRPTTEMTVYAPDVAGLKVGAPVRLAGMDIGYVSDLHFERGRVAITMSVDAEGRNRIGPSARITIRSMGLMGEKYLNITPGNHVAPGQVQTETEVTALTPKIEETLGQVTSLLASINQGKGTVGALVSDRKLYDNLAEVSRDLKAFSAQLKEQGTLQKLLTDDTIFVRLEKSAARAEQLLTRLESNNGTLGRLMNDPSLYDEGKQAVAGLKGVTADVRSGKGTAGKLMTDDQLYEEARETLKEARASIKEVKDLVADIKRDPKRYFKFSVF